MTTSTIPMSEFSQFMQGLNTKLSTGMDGLIAGLREAAPLIRNNVLSEAVGQNDRVPGSELYFIALSKRETSSNLQWGRTHVRL